MNINEKNKKKIQRKLRRFDGDTMADWLGRGIMSVYSSSTPQKVITLDHIGSLDVILSVSVTLVYVYQEFMSAPVRALFRKALGDLLRRYCNDPSAPIQVFQDLICLIAATKATESLDALYPVLGNGGIGKRHPEIIYEAIAILAPAIGDYKKMTELMESQNFKEEIYLTKVIKVFAKCNRSLAIEIVQRYISIFQFRYGEDVRKATEELYKVLANKINDLTQALISDK